MHIGKKPFSPSKKYPPGSFMGKVRKRRIIETLAAFIGGGVAAVEFVYHILVHNYHFPKYTTDITIIVIALAMICTVCWRWFRKEKREETEEPKAEPISLPEWKNSIVVLPFVNISGEEEQEYFCDGLTEELINKLSNIRELKVPARTSAFAFKGEKIDIREVGHKLNVDKALEGSVRKVANQIRISAQLINIEDGYHVWSEQFDREIEDVFAIQDEISLAIVDKLKIKLFEGEKAKLLKRYTNNLEAYNSYLKGRYFWNKRYKNSMQIAMGHFQKAIDKDPSYALAYSGVADCYWVFGAWHFIRPNEAFSKAKAAAEKVLELDSSLAEGYTSIGVIKWVFDWNWSGTERAFKQAIEINPNYALAHCYYGHFLAAMGRSTEAMEEAKKAQELEPLSLVINSNNGLTFYLSRQYDQAINAFQNALDIDPNSVIALLWIAWTYMQKSMNKEAIAAIQKAEALVEGSTLWLSNLGMAYSVADNRSEAQRILKDLQRKAKKQYVAAIHFVWIYIGLSDKDQAFKWLDRAYEEHNAQLYSLKTDPIYDSLRSDPRFTKLLKKIGLEK